MIGFKLNFYYYVNYLLIEPNTKTCKITEIYNEIK